MRQRCRLFGLWTLVALMGACFYDAKRLRGLGEDGGGGGAPVLDAGARSDVRQDANLGGAGGVIPGTVVTTGGAAGARTTEPTATGGSPARGGDAAVGPGALSDADAPGEVAIDVAGALGVGGADGHELGIGGAVATGGAPATGGASGSVGAAGSSLTGGFAGSTPSGGMGPSSGGSGGGSTSHAGGKDGHGGNNGNGHGGADAGTAPDSCPAGNKVGRSCGSCGGSTLCDGSCSVATPSNFGSACIVLDCLCSLDLVGTVDCAGACAPSSPCRCCGILPCSGEPDGGTGRRP